MKNESTDQKRSSTTLTEKVTASLRSDILNGSFKPGTMLPTEPILTKQFSVSRTVVREAIAALKAEGLLKPRQGSGVLVLEPSKPSWSPFEIDYSLISDVLEVLELRMAIEIEATSLACDRYSMAQQAKIFEALNTMTEQVKKGELAIEADFEFHRAIASATNNSRYVEFLDFLGDKTIPRAQLRLKPIAETDQIDYMTQILKEHQCIYEAIAKRDAQSSRTAMRNHLSRSQTRYQSLLSG